ncbi:MAG: indolepyruvate ferredoxin oxidoreductase subunit alpha [Methanomassiliicoccales archaeon]|nr:MAG: indolepyruvate ferredoxin oxidoreductase subunit alpha [Methanomassiliicoccales archaeon]
MNRILSDNTNERILALGNEAIVRGAIESGLDVASTYPGTPSSEIGDVLYRIAEELGIYFEYSVNEKVALELGTAASISGLNALTFMKHVGLNVASDAFTSLAYVGVRGGHVIVSADDPGCHSSQNEQDNRWYSKLANIPLLEPSSPQEAKDMVISAFEMSSSLELPVLLRTTTRVSHTRAPISLGKIKSGKGKSRFKRKPERFMLVPKYALENHKWLLDRMKKAEKLSEESKFNFIYNKEATGKIGFVTSGVSYAYCLDVLKKLDMKAKILKLGMTNPIPKKMCTDFARDLEAIIVLEELDPFLENEIKSIALENKIPHKVYGKENGHFPKYGEFNTDIVKEGILRIISEDFPDIKIKQDEKDTFNVKPVSLPSRPPVLCPGCPHRATAYAAKKVSSEDSIFPMDIGCYTLVLQRPLKTADIVLCMGSSIGTACGFAEATDQMVIAFIGDSTFFHAGIPGLINAVHAGHKFVLSILDNSTTAMTGFQPHPGVEMGGEGRNAKGIDIFEVVKGCGVESVKVVDPYDLKKTMDAFKEALENPTISVVIARHPCALVEYRVKRRMGEKIVEYDVDKDTCIQCYTCTSNFGCPASSVGEDEFPGISPHLCVGCGVCAEVCPSGAIQRVDKKEEGKAHE